MQNLITEMAILIIVATIGGLIAKFFKQPLIPTYIIMGFLLGPVLHIIKDGQNVIMLSEIGVAFLLFIVGLELDLSKLKEVGDVSTFGGALQALLMFGLGYFGTRLLGLSHLTAIYMGIVLSFSSTMVVIKILSDRNELDTLHGRIVIGLLLLQDVLAIITLSLFRNTSGGSSLITSLGFGVVIIIVSFFIGRALFPPIFRHAARSIELLFLLAVSICFFFVLLFAHLGFSIAVGGFIAGVLLGNLPYNIEIISRVRPLKDFFTVLFFTSIGLQISFTGFKEMVPLFLFLFLMTTIVSPFLTILITMLFGYKKRTAFLTGINLSQSSIFALILVTSGLTMGYISQQIFSVILILTVTTFVVSSYLSKYEESIYGILKRPLSLMEKMSKRNRGLENLDIESTHDTVLIGYDRTGYSIFQTLRRLKRDFVVVDFDPDVIRQLLNQNVPCIYGDIGDREVVDKLKLSQVKLIISTIPNHQENLRITRELKKKHGHAQIIVTSYQTEEALELYDAGADYVIIPHFLGGEHVSLMLEDVTTNLDKLIMTKLEHIKELKKREKLRPKKNRY